MHIAVLLFPALLLAQGKTGVWLLSTLQYDGENLVVCDANYTRIRIYTPEGESAHAELSKDSDGGFVVTPCGYSSTATNDGFTLTSNSSAQFRQGICSESWRRIDNVPASLCNYIMSQCRAIDSVPEEIQELLRQNFLSEDDRVFIISEEEPAFPGGKAALQDFLDANMRYPGDGTRYRMTGTVNVYCIIEKDGHPSSARVTGSKLNAKKMDETLRAAIVSQFENEALRLVYLMPAWVPARQRGRAVRHEVSVEVSFKPTAMSVQVIP